MDFYQLQDWDPLTPVEETLRFHDEAVRADRIHYIGPSTFTGWQTQLTLATAAALGLQRSRSRCSSSTALVCHEIDYEVIPRPCTTTSVCCPRHPWPAGSSPASTSTARRRPAAPG